MLRAFIRRPWRKIQRAVNRRTGPFRLGRLGPNPRIVIGAGTRHLEGGWIETDQEFLDLLKPEDWRRFFRPDSIAALLAEHVWEHLTVDQGVQAAHTCFTYLRPGGYLRLAVPDGLHPDQTYIDWVKVGGRSPGQLANGHKVLYTYHTLHALFQSVGFETRFYEYFDDNRQFRFIDWDPAKGHILRSKRFDKRNRDGNLRFTSIVMDAVKPMAVGGHAAGMGPVQVSDMTVITS
jgi:predicted SAM-dependent methyltransferase